MTAQHDLNARDSRVAYHEAGHTLAILAFAPNWFRSVDIEHTQAAEGRTTFDGGVTQAGLKRICETWSITNITAYVNIHVCISISGWLGQDYEGQEVEESAVDNDVVEAMILIVSTQKARGVSPEQEESDLDAILEACQKKMRALFDREARFLHELAFALLHQRSLNREEVFDLYHVHWQGQKVK